MKVFIALTKGYIAIESMSDQGVMQLIEGLNNRDQETLILSLGGGSLTHILRENVVRIDLDEESSE